MRATRIALFVLAAAVMLVAITGAVVAVSASNFSDQSMVASLLTLLLLALIASLSATMHRPAYRVGTITLGFILTAVWAFLILACANTSESGKQGQSILVLLYVGIPAAAALMCRTKPWAKSFSNLLVGTAVVCGAAAMYSIWCISETGGFGVPDLKNKVMISSVWTSLCLASVSLLLINVGRGNRGYFRWPCITTALAALFCGLDTLWRGGNLFSTETVGNESLPFHITADIAFWIAVTGAFVNLSLMTRWKGTVRLLKWITVLLCVLTGATMIALLSWEFRYQEAFTETKFGHLVTVTFDALLFLFTGSILCMLIARAPSHAWPAKTSRTKAWIRWSSNARTAASSRICPLAGPAATAFCGSACRSLSRTAPGAVTC